MTSELRETSSSWKPIPDFMKVMGTIGQIFAGKRKRRRTPNTRRKLNRTALARLPKTRIRAACRLRALD
jgi:hypothetical protein